MSTKEKSLLTPKKIVDKTKKKTSNVNRRENVKCCHTEQWNYTIETDSRYCKEEMDLHGVKCDRCKAAFGTRKQIPPCRTQPTFVCNNRTITGCNHSFCAVCYLRMLNDNDNNSKRRTQRNIK